MVSIDGNRWAIYIKTMLPSLNRDGSSYRQPSVWDNNKGGGGGGGS